MLYGSELFTFDLNTALDACLNRGARFWIDQGGTKIMFMNLGPLLHPFVLPNRRPGLVPQIHQLLFELGLLSRLLFPLALLKLFVESLGSIPFLEGKFFDLTTEVEHHIVPCGFLGVGAFPEREQVGVAQFGVCEKVVGSAFCFCEERVLFGLGISTANADWNVEITQELEVDVARSAVLAFVIVVCSQEDCYFIGQINMLLGKYTVRGTQVCTYHIQNNNELMLTWVGLCDSWLPFSLL